MDIITDRVRVIKKCRSEGGTDLYSYLGEEYAVKKIGLDLRQVMIMGRSGTQYKLDFDNVAFLTPIEFKGKRVAIGDTLKCHIYGTVTVSGFYPNRKGIGLAVYNHNDPRVMTLLGDPLNQIVSHEVLGGKKELSEEDLEF